VLNLRSALRCALAAAIAFAAMPCLGAQAAPQPSHCELRGFAARVSGTCGRIFDEQPKITLAPKATITHGMWRSDARPKVMWAGDMTDEGYPNAAVELEIYEDNTGVLRTIYGWFPVGNYVTSETGITFDLDATREVAPNALDRKIIERAAELLSNVAVWNRADNRQCPARAQTWSIYCALEDATSQVTGGNDHRRPALEIVRKIIDVRSARRNYDHRIMDYNNDPTTTLADVKSIFDEALQRMADPSWLVSHDFEPEAP
jgi:hypothetical protein